MRSRSGCPGPCQQAVSLASNDNRLRPRARRQVEVDAIAIATPVSTHGLLAREALRAGKHVLVEKPLAASAAEALDLIRARPSARPGSHAGPYVPLQSAGQSRPRIHRLRRAGRDLLHLDEPGEPWSPSARRQRRLGPRAARLLDPALLARRARRRRSTRSHAAASSRRSRTSRSSTWGFRPGRSPTSSSPGWRRASCGGQRWSARERWSCTTTPAPSQSVCSTRVQPLGIHRASANTG